MQQFSVLHQRCSCQHGNQFGSRTAISSPPPAAPAYETSAPPLLCSERRQGCGPGAPETIRGSAVQSLPTRSVISFVQGSLPAGHANIHCGMLSSLAIGHTTARGSTPLYMLTPRPRVRQTSRLLVIGTSLSQSLVLPVFPSRKWTLRQPTLPNWCQHPQTLSTHAPKPPDLRRFKKHLRSMKDPVARTSSPYTDPSVKGPRSQFLTSHGQSSSAAKSMSPLLTVVPWRFMSC